MPLEFCIPRQQPMQQRDWKLLCNAARLDPRPTIQVVRASVCFLSDRLTFIYTLQVLASPLVTCTFIPSIDFPRLSS